MRTVSGLDTFSSAFDQLDFFREILLCPLSILLLRHTSDLWCTLDLAHDWLHPAEVSQAARSAERWGRVSKGGVRGPAYFRKRLWGGWRLAFSVCSTLCNPMDCSLSGSSVHGIFQVRNTGVGCHFLLQGIFPTQGSNLCLSPVLAGRFFTTCAIYEVCPFLY